MNYTKFLSTVLFFFATINIASAQAMKPYMGLEFHPWNKHTFYSDTQVLYTDTLDKHELAGNFYVGVNFHANFALEFGYTRRGTAKAKIIGTPGEDSFKSYNTYLDLVGSTSPVNNFMLIGTLGGGRINISADGVLAGGVGDSSYTKFGGRVGLGIGYQLAEHLDARLMYRFQKVGSRNDRRWVKNTTDFAIGMTYFMLKSN